MSETPAGGKQVIREAVAARRSAWAMMARDCGCALDLINAFAQGRADIPADNLDLIVKWIWRENISYNAEADAIMAVPQPEARTIGALPTLNIIGLPFTPGANQRPGPQPVDAPKPKPKPRGWLSWEE